MHVRTEAMTTTLCSKTLKRAYTPPFLLSFSLWRLLLHSQEPLSWIHVVTSSGWISLQLTSQQPPQSWFLPLPGPPSFSCLQDTECFQLACCPIGPSWIHCWFLPALQFWVLGLFLISPLILPNPLCKNTPKLLFWISDVCIPTAHLRSTFCPHSGSKRIRSLKSRWKAVYCYKENEGYIK